MQLEMLDNRKAVESAQAHDFKHTTHRYAPFLEKVLFLCFNNPKHQ